MNGGFDAPTLALGALIFVARVGDVSLGTLRTLAIVQGRTWVSFFLGLVEVSMWLVVIAAVLDKIAARPILGLFYAFGFATGNIAGIMLERKIAFGDVALRVICPECADTLPTLIRAEGFGVTVFPGQGLHGPVTMIYIVCRRRDLARILRIVERTAPDAFYTTEMMGGVLKLNRPVASAAGGWRAVLKRK